MKMKTKNSVFNPEFSFELGNAGAPKIAQKRKLEEIKKEANDSDSEQDDESKKELETLIKKKGNIF